MREVFTAEQVRTAERVVLDRVPPGALMRRAAFGLAAFARRMLAGTAGRRVTLLVGAGDNGGDALWAGAELRRRGVGVTAVLLNPERAHAQGLAALRRAGGRVVGSGPDAVAAVVRADLVMDGVVGLSGRGPLRPAAAELVDAADRAGVPVLAVDSPSGIDPDTGAVDGPAVTAAATVTFGARKPVHVLAAHRCGPVHLVDIGLGPELPGPFAHVLDDADVAARWPVPGPADDKYTQGVTGVAAGSATYPGAAVLATGAAVLATSGMVRFAGTAADGVRARWPEVVAADDISVAGRTQSWAVGPGIGTDDGGRALLAAVLDRDVPVCIDADGVTLLGQHDDLRAAVAGRPVVITPHDREFARVAGDVGNGPGRGGAPGRRGAGRDGAAQGQRDGRRRSRRPCARAPVDDVVGGDGGVGRRADRDRRRPARGRARAVVGGRLRGVPARPGGGPRGRRRPGPGVGDPGRDPRGDPGRSRQLTRRGPRPICAGSAGGVAPVLGVAPRARVCACWGRRGSGREAWVWGSGAEWRCRGGCAGFSVSRRVLGSAPAAGGAGGEGGAGRRRWRGWRWRGGCAGFSASRRVLGFAPAAGGAGRGRWRGSE